MRLIRLLVLFLIAYGMPYLHAQVAFSERPSSIQLYPRNANDSATVSISGLVTTSGFIKTIFTTHKNGILADSSVAVLSYNGNNAPFAYSFPIHAEKSHHRFKMYLYNGSSSTLILRADSICSGDVYLINGQSNATAVANGPGTESGNIWVRSFGTQNNVETTCLADTAWGMGNGANGNNHLSIGVWAIRLGKMFADSSGIPVCLINGSRSGTRIIEHLPSSTNHADLTSLYGRLLYRAQKAKLTNSVKGLFWYQGESDTDTAYLQYANRFGQLYNAWKQDFPGLNEIIVIQTRPGCLITQTTLYHQQTREILRSLSNTYPDITLMSTAGIPNFDGCHFTTFGYQQLAQMLYAKLCDDFIGKPAIPESDPPVLLNAVYSNNSNTELSLIFDQPVLWPALYNGYNLKDYLYLNSTVTIINGSSSNDTVRLQLSVSTNANKITYLPGIYYAGTNTEYNGPWLLNTKNVGTPSFYQFGITNNLVISADRPTSICNTDSVILSTLRTGQSYQWYLNNVIISGAITQQYVAKVPGVYTLVVKDANNLAVTSNAITISYGTGTKPEISSANGKSSFCTGNSLTLDCNTGITWLWNTGETTSSITTSNPGSYIVSITSSNGCAGVSDTFNINIDIPAKPVITPDKPHACVGDSVKFSIDNYPGILWNNGSIEPFIYVGDSNVYSVTITDTIGCNATSDPASTSIHSLPDAFINASAIRACPGQTISLSSVNPASSYSWSTGQTTSGIVVSTSGEYGLSITDQYGCSNIASSVQVFIVAPMVSINPSGSKVICVGTKQTLTAVYNSSANSFQWYKNNVAIANATNSIYQASTAGTYSVRYTDIYGCTATSSGTAISTASAPTASFNVTNQFDVCNDTVVTCTANAASGLAYQWQKNSVDIPGANSQVYISGSKGTYRVITSNIYGCSKTASAKVIPVVNPTAPTITASGPTTFCTGDSVVLTSSTGTGYTFQWYKGSPAIAGATAQTYTAKTAGSYKVKVTIPMGCTAMSAATTIKVNSCGSRIMNAAEEEEAYYELSVYPQPFSSDFIISLPREAIKGNYYFEMHNAAGALVIQPRSIVFNNSEAIIKASMLARGIYFYKLVSDDKVYNGRVVKE